MMGSNACYNCVKSSHMMKGLLNRRGQEKGKENVQPNCPSEEAPRRHRLFPLNLRGAEEGSFGDVSGA